MQHQSLADQLVEDPLLEFGFVEKGGIELIAHLRTLLLADAIHGVLKLLLVDFVFADLGYERLDVRAEIAFDAKE